MKTTNIFCILAKTGSGKTKYINQILNDKEFTKEHEISLLVYGTTRSKRSGEKEGVDYFYHTQKQYDKIKDDDLIESRSYYTMNDGEIYYFTKTDYVNKDGNIICIASPYQFENFKSWFTKENIKGERKYSLNVILIEVDLKIRVERILNRALKDSDIYEMCRRVIQEKNEFEDVQKRVPELARPEKCDNVCILDNSSSEKSDIDKNVEKIKTFILEHSK